jgi:inner membrane protein
MMGRSHLVSGVVSGMAVCAVVDPPTAMVPVIVLVSAYSALTPDLDHPAAPAARVLGPVSWALCMFTRFLSARTTGAAHRGLSHSLLFAFAWGLLVLSASLSVLHVQPALWIAGAAVLGCVTHIAGDCLTLSGCQYVLWPLRAQVVWPRLLRFRTGGSGERVVFWLLAGAGVLLLPAVLS